MEQIAFHAGAHLASCVVAMLVLEHVEHLPSIFTESARVLRAGGEMFLCEFHPMQQLQGRQAAFTHPRTGERQRVPAFLRAGFKLVQMGEWRDPEAPRSAVPRLLSLHFWFDVTPSA